MPETKPENLRQVGEVTLGGGKAVILIGAGGDFWFRVMDEEGGSLDEQGPFDTIVEASGKASSYLLEPKVPRWAPNDVVILPYQRRKDGTPFRGIVKGVKDGQVEVKVPSWVVHTFDQFALVKDETETKPPGLIY